MTIPKPADTEYASFYAGYVGKVAGAGGPVPVLEAQAQVFERLAAQSEVIGDHRYADGKWSVKELVGHMADTERVFAYRLLRIARADATPLSGFDENAWAAVAPHGRRALCWIMAGHAQHHLDILRERYGLKV